MAAAWTTELVESIDCDEKVDPENNAEKSSPMQSGMMADGERCQSTQHKAGEA
jgi:hypothetical protein